MECPICKNVNSHKKVLRTWLGKNNILRRKRRCTHCKGLFHTVELVIVKEKVIVEEMGISY